MIRFVSDIYEGLRTFMIGMKVTAQYLKDSNLKAGTVTTTTYDGSLTLARAVKVSERFRGHLHNDIDRCIACRACARTCPIDCIWIDVERNEANKLRPSRFDNDQLKCMYCGQCVHVCPTHCLTMTKEWWGATFSDPDALKMHGQLRQFGAGYYTLEQRAEVERKRLEAAEAKKRAAAAKAPGAAPAVGPDDKSAVPPVG
jgi:formate hydrogenlyase subunit 6/NADH:ubiquinone oxidoreductase subunit I